MYPIICVYIYIFVLKYKIHIVNYCYFCCYYFFFFYDLTVAAAAVHSIVRDDVVVVVNEAEAFGNRVQIIAIVIFFFKLSSFYINHPSPLSPRAVVAIHE